VLRGPEGIRFTPRCDGIVIGLNATTAIGERTYEGEIQGQDNSHADTVGVRFTWWNARLCRAGPTARPHRTTAQAVQLAIIDAAFDACFRARPIEALPAMPRMALAGSVHEAI
jgi:hypothetical protein